MEIVIFFLLLILETFFLLFQVTTHSDRGLIENDNLLHYFFTFGEATKNFFLN